MPRSKRVDAKTSTGVLNPLAALPIYIRKIPGSKSFRNSRTGERLTYGKALSIAQSVNRVVAHEDIIAKRWDLRVDLHEVGEDGTYMRVVEGHAG